MANNSKAMISAQGHGFTRRAAWFLCILNDYKSHVVIFQNVPGWSFICSLSNRHTSAWVINPPFPDSENSWHRPPFPQEIADSRNKEKITVEVNYMTEQLFVEDFEVVADDVLVSAACSHSKCSWSAATSSNSPSGRHGSSSSPASCGRPPISSHIGQSNLACQSRCIGGMWFAMTTGAKTISLSSRAVFVIPIVCHSVVGFFGGGCATTGRANPFWPARLVGTAARSSHIMWPSQKSHTKAISWSPKRSKLPTRLHAMSSSTHIFWYSASPTAPFWDHERCTRYTRNAPRHLADDSCSDACIRLAARHWARCRARCSDLVSRSHVGLMGPPDRAQSFSVWTCRWNWCRKALNSSTESSVCANCQHLPRTGLCPAAGLP